MGLKYSKKPYVAIAVLGSNILVDIIIIIVMFATQRNYEPALDVIMNVLVPLLVIPTIGFLSVIIYQRVQRKKQEKWRQTDYDELLEDVGRKQKHREEIKLVLEPIVFQGNRENQKCSLCNKVVLEGHIIMICPKCASLYHHDHLLDWLKDNPLCPVCNEDL